jgi:hypothetical protein
MDTVVKVLMSIFNPIPNPVPAFRVQRNRQILVLIWAVAILICYLLVFYLPGRPLLVSALIANAFGVILMVATRNIPSSVNSNIDEREKASRDHVHRVAYWIVLIPISLMLGLLFSVSDQPELLSRWNAQLDTGKRLALLGASGAFFGGLPTALYAWLEPDPLLED